MRFLRGLSFLGMIASLAVMVFQDSGLAEKLSPSPQNKSGESTANPKISMVETLKTLQKMKKMRQDMEKDLLSNCGGDCPVKVVTPAPVPSVRAPSQELESPPPQAQKPVSPLLKVNYQPPDLGPQTIQLADSQNFIMIELSQNSLISFEIPKGLSRCLYLDPKGVMTDCSQSQELSTLRTVNPKDIGLHRFQFIISQAVFEYRVQVVGIR
jgi:hypothetical protein